MARGHIPQVLKENSLIEPRKNRICLLENHNIKWIWDERELMIILQMWKQELHVYYMAEYLKIDPDEALLALIHLKREKKLPSRKSGLLDGVIGCYVPKQ